MKQLEQVWKSVKEEEAALLATSAGGRVTMRTVSPVYDADTVLIFTGVDTVKYRQLKENPNCCFALGGFFLEASAEFLGPTMAEENEALRQVYAQKFKGAFDEGIEHGGRESEFVRFLPTRVYGWGFEGGAPGSGWFEYSFK